jgi:hypothetical protein
MVLKVSGSVLHKICRKLFGQFSTSTDIQKKLKIFPWHYNPSILYRILLNTLFIAILGPVFLVQFLLFKGVHFFNFLQKGILLFNSLLRVQGGFSSLDSISCRSYGKVSTIVSCLPHCTIHRVLEWRTYLSAFFEHPSYLLFWLCQYTKNISLLRCQKSNRQPTTM